MADDVPPLEELLERARGGDVCTQGQLLERFRAYLTLLARVQIGRRLQRKADCADVVQEAFLDAAQQFAHFRGSTELELAAWLRQILAGHLSHLVRRYLGTQRRNVRLERDLGDDLDRSSGGLGGLALAAAHSTPSERASRREQAVLLADAIERLPEDYRDVITLRHMEGLTFPQVAERMGRSVDSVEKLWLRAVTRLRQTVGVQP